jgi:precorrin-2 dehydrogenase/sirohydrochlorin ferrochelatase
MYPVMLNLKEKQVVIIGGGNIAARKIEKLRETGCNITVVAPHIAEVISNDPAVEIIQASYDKKYIADAQLIFACTDNKVVNQQVANDATKWQWVNDCSQQQNSDFFNMAMVLKDDIVISISTVGKQPSTAKRLKGELVEFLNKQHNSDNLSTENNNEEHLK